MIKIIQGSKAQLTVRLYQGANGVIGDPIDLSGATLISTCFQKMDGTELMLTSASGGGIVVLGNPLLGKIQLALTSAQSAQLAITDHETLELALTYGIGMDPQKIQIPEAYAVLVSRC